MDAGMINFQISSSTRKIQNQLDSLNSLSQPVPFQNEVASEVRDKFDQLDSSSQESSLIELGKWAQNRIQTYTQFDTEFLKRVANMQKLTDEKVSDQFRDISNRIDHWDQLLQNAMSNLERFHINFDRFWSMMPRGTDSDNGPFNVSRSKFEKEKSEDKTKSQNKKKSVELFMKEIEEERRKNKLREEHYLLIIRSLQSFLNKAKDEMNDFKQKQEAASQELKDLINEHESMQQEKKAQELIIQRYTEKEESHKFSLLQRKIEQTSQIFIDISKSQQKPKLVINSSDYICVRNGQSNMSKNDNQQENFVADHDEIKKNKHFAIICDIQPDINLAKNKSSERGQKDSGKHGYEAVLGNNIPDQTVDAIQKLLEDGENALLEKSKNQNEEFEYEYEEQIDSNGNKTRTKTKRIINPSNDSNSQSTTSKTSKQNSAKSNQMNSNLNRGPNSNKSNSGLSDGSNSDHNGNIQKSYSNNECGMQTNITSENITNIYNTVEQQQQKIEVMQEILVSNNLMTADGQIIDQSGSSQSLNKNSNGQMKPMNQDNCSTINQKGIHQQQKMNQQKLNQMNKNSQNQRSSNDQMYSNDESNQLNDNDQSGFMKNGQNQMNSHNQPGFGSNGQNQLTSNSNGESEFYGNGHNAYHSNGQFNPNGQPGFDESNQNQFNSDGQQHINSNGQYGFDGNGQNQFNSNDQFGFNGNGQNQLNSNGPNEYIERGQFNQNDQSQYSINNQNYRRNGNFNLNHQSEVNNSEEQVFNQDNANEEHYTIGVPTINGRPLVRTLSGEFLSPNGNPLKHNNNFSLTDALHLQQQKDIIVPVYQTIPALIIHHYKAEYMTKSPPGSPRGSARKKPTENFIYEDEVNNDIDNNDIVAIRGKQILIQTGPLHFPSAAYTYYNENGDPMSLQHVTHYISQHNRPQRVIIHPRPLKLKSQIPERIKPFPVFTQDNENKTVHIDRNIENNAHNENTVNDVKFDINQPTQMKIDSPRIRNKKLQPLHIESVINQSIDDEKEQYRDKYLRVMTDQIADDMVYNPRRNTPRSSQPSSRRSLRESTTKMIPGEVQNNGIGLTITPFSPHISKPVSPHSKIRSSYND